ncbi:unnamed protein product [Caenorhabditis brenneri]
MFSRLTRFHDFRTRDASHPDAPPPYENNDGKRVVEVSEPPPNADFEPVEKQRHFWILRYTVNNRFRKIMLIGAVNVVLIVGVLVTVILLNRGGNGSTSEGSVTITTTTTTERPAPTTHPITTTTRPPPPITTVTHQPVVTCAPSTGTTFLSLIIT